MHFTVYFINRSANVILSIIVFNFPFAFFLMVLIILTEALEMVFCANVLAFFKTLQAV